MPSPRVPRLACALLLAAAPAAAQSPLSLDLTIGGSHGLGGGERRDRTTPTVDATLAWRLRRGASGPVVAAGANVQGTTSTLDLVPGGGGGFAFSFPAFASVGPLAGWESRRPSGAALRALAGPAYFHETSAEEGTVGAHARLDAATPPWGRVAAVASLRGALLGYRAETLGIAALAVGLRVQ